MNTFCLIWVEGEDNTFIEEAIEETFSELKRIESLFSRYKSDSQITKLNQAVPKAAVKVDAEVFCLIARSLELSRITYGAFDISIGAAVDFWRLSESKNILPTESQIEELQAKLGYQNIVLDFNEQTVRFTKPGAQIDFGALAKGYGLNRAVAILKERGIERAQVNLGGNIYVIDSQPQTIAIRNPVLPHEVITTIGLASNSISTSANYERFFTIGKKRFGHLLNPLTGYPVESDILSASLVSPDAALADALSTAIFVLGFEKARWLLRGIEEVEAVIICKVKFSNKLKVYQLKGGVEK